MPDIRLTFYLVLLSATGIWNFLTGQISRLVVQKCGGRKNLVHLREGVPQNYSCGTLLSDTNTIYLFICQLEQETKTT